jgi:hypothetical protein
LTLNRTIWWSLAWLAASLVSAPLLAVSALDYSAQSPSAAQIDDFLSRKNSPIAGIGAALVGYARDYDIDPRLVIAIAGAETTFGLHQCTDNNAWNWFHKRACPQSAFTSYQEGAEHVTRFMRLSYLNRGYDTIELIRYKYCTTGCDNWTPLVTSFRDAMPAGAASPPVPPASTPVQQPMVTPDPAPSSAPPRGDNQIFGLPRYLVFFLGALFVGAWAISGFKK